MTICMAAALAASLSCGLEVPGDRSALVLTIEGDGECAQSRFVRVRFFSGGTEVETWGFLTDEGLPYTYELWTRLEGDVEVKAEGYLCPGGDCRGVEERPDLLAGQGSGVVPLVHGRRVPLTVVISPRRCGNGVIEAGEECDAGEGSPADACGPPCIYDLRSVSSDAGGEGDSFTAFPLGDGFAAAWTAGAGSDTTDSDSVGLMLFDVNGLARPEAPGEIVDSCAGNPSLRLASPGISGWGGGGPAALLVYPESDGTGDWSLCFALLGGDGAVTLRGRMLESASMPPGESFPVTMINDAYAASAGMQGPSLVLHVVGIADGVEKGRAEVEALVTGEECSGVSLVSLDGDFAAAAWRKKSAGGDVLTMLGRWDVDGQGELMPFDIAPVELGEEPSAIARGTGLASPASGTPRLVVVTTAGSAVETVWLDKGSPQGNFESVSFDAGLEPGAVIAGAEFLETGAVHVLVAHPSPDPGRCSLTLLRIPGPGAGDDPLQVQSWGESGPLGCEAKLLRLPGQRGAVVFRTLVEEDPGILRGDLMVDIVATRE